MTIRSCDELIPLSMVPVIILEITGVSRGVSSVRAWIKKGCRTIDGRVVRLEAVKRLGQIFTTKKAVKDFIEGVG